MPSWKKWLTTKQGSCTYPISMLFILQDGESLHWQLKSVTVPSSTPIIPQNLQPSVCQSLWGLEAESSSQNCSHTQPLGSGVTEPACWPQPPGMLAWKYECKINIHIAQKLMIGMLKRLMQMHQNHHATYIYCLWVYWNALWSFAYFTLDKGRYIPHKTSTQVHYSGTM